MVWRIEKRVGWPPNELAGRYSRGDPAAISMTPERWRQVDELYHAVLDVPTANRPALLEQADPEVRREVESLLAQESSPLDRPAWEVPAEIKSGTQPGHYKIE